MEETEKQTMSEPQDEAPGRPIVIVLLLGAAAVGFLAIVALCLRLG